MNCAACTSPVPDGARFCPQCGTVVTAAAPARELRKSVTVLFCDMADSTALSGRLDPESLREVMVRYYALMRECLERHGGTVEKFIGDAVVAVFGVPVLHEDDARRALSAATEMLRAVEALNEELRALVGVEIGIRVGVNTGEVVAAEDVTSGQLLASGEAMNIAARLQQHAGVGQIVIGPVTRLLVERDSVLASLGSLSLKGVADPVPAWRLVELRPPGTSVFRDPDLPFLGRQAELDQLARLMAQGTDCQLVVVHGDPGVGKTRLAAEFAAQAGSRGALVGLGRCQPYGEGTPLHALGEALRQVVAATSSRAAAGHDFDEALTYLQAGLLLDGSPGELPDQLIWAMTQVLRQIGSGHPVLLVLDDLQAAKPVLRDILRRLADRFTGAPVLLLGVARPELIEDNGWTGVRFLPLAPLSPDDSRLLVAALSEVAPHRNGMTEEIVERAGGNPFFLEQLVALSGRSAPGTNALPPTVRSVIAARLDLLRPLERDVLLRAAVPGVRFSAPELGAVLVAEPPIPDLPEQALGTLTRRRLIVKEAVADGYRFSGVLVRDVAYHTLSKRDRLRYHEALAGWYQRQTLSPDLAGMHLERAYRLVAELHPAHQRVGQLRLEAARTLGVAGVRALRRSDLHWAADLLGQSFELHEEGSPERATVGVQLAETRMLLGTDPDAQQTLQGLARAASAAGDRRTASHAYLLLAAIELPGPSAAEEAMATVPVFEAAGDDLGLARAWLRVAQLRQLAGRYGDAEELLLRALRHALRSGMELELATVIGGLATSLWRGPAPAGDAVNRCRRLLAEYGGGRRAVRAAVNCPHAVLLAYRGEHNEARALVRSSMQIITDLGHAYGATAMMIFAANVEGLAGRWDAAEELLRDAALSSERHGDTLSHSAANAALARARLERSHGGGTAHIGDIGAVTSDPFLDADTYGVRARILAARGDRDQALHTIGRAAAAADITDSTACRATAELDRAHVLRALGDEAKAAAAARAAAILFNTKGHLVGARWAGTFVEVT